MKPYKRRRLWVDPPFQFRLLLRMGLYLLLFAVTVLHIGFTFHFMMDFARNGVRMGIDELYLEYLSQQTPLLYTLILLAPILLYNLLKFSHRIAGPLYRCRKVMQEMASGAPVPEFIPRKHDLMRELFQAFNELIIEWNTRVQTNVNGHLASGKPGEMPAKEKTAEKSVGV